MTAPRGVELDEDVLSVVEDDLLVVVGNDDGDGAVLLLGNRLALDAGLHLAAAEVVDELGDGLDGDVLGLLEGELLVLDRVLDGERRPLANLEVQVARVLAERLGVDGGKVDLALVLLGNRLQLGGERLALLLSLGEDVGEGKASLRLLDEFFLGGSTTHAHVALVCVRADLANQGSGGLLGERFNVLLLELAVVHDLALIERLVENNGGLLDTVLLGEISVVGGAEEVVVAHGVGRRGEGSVGPLVVRTEVADEDHGIGRLEVLEAGAIVDVGHGGEGLLGHVGDDAEGD